MDNENQPLYVIVKDELFDDGYWVIDTVYYSESGPYDTREEALEYIESMMP